MSERIVIMPTGEGDYLLTILPRAMEEMGGPVREGMSSEQLNAMNDILTALESELESGASSHTEVLIHYEHEYLKTRLSTGHTALYRPVTEEEAKVRPDISLPAYLIFGLDSNEPPNEADIGQAQKLKG
jgi:hypothetical protein